MKKVSRLFGGKKSKSASSTANRSSDSACTDISFDLGNTQINHDWNFPPPIDPILHPSLAKDVHSHVSADSKIIHKWKLRCAWSTALTWWKQIKSMNHPSWEGVKNFILGTQFGHLLELDWPQNDAALIFALVERWWDTTHTFHFPWGELGITPLDFSMLTGLGLGVGEPIPFDDDHESFADAQHFFPCLDLLPTDPDRLTQSQISSGGVSLTWLFNRYSKRFKNLPNYPLQFPSVVLEYARAFVFFLVGNCFFKCRDTYVRLGWMQAAISAIENPYQLDFGGAIYTHLVNGLDVAVRGSGHLHGFSVILPFWWYEYIRSANPILKADTDVDTIPRINTWGKSCRAKVYNETSHNAFSCRDQLELINADRVNWRPWEESRWLKLNAVEVEAIEDLGKKRHVIAAQAASLMLGRRIIFNSEWNTAVWFLGDRCWRQSLGVSRIPYPPPDHMDASDVPYEIIKSCRAMFIFGWPDASNYLIDGDYDRYWARVGRGTLLSDRHRSNNVDGVTSAALRGTSTFGKQPPSQFTQWGSYPLASPIPDSIYHDGASSSIDYTQTPSMEEGGNCDAPLQPPDYWSYPKWQPNGVASYVPVASQSETYMVDLTMRAEQLSLDETRDQLVDSQAFSRSLQDELYENSRIFYETELEKNRLEALLAAAQTSNETRRKKRGRRGEN